jgi:hypothetical protein
MPSLARKVCKVAEGVELERIWLLFAVLAVGAAHGSATDV